jgi:hypothetical protein
MDFQDIQEIVELANSLKTYINENINNIHNLDSYFKNNSPEAININSIVEKNFILNQEFSNMQDKETKLNGILSQVIPEYNPLPILTEDMLLSISDSIYVTTEILNYKQSCICALSNFMYNISKFRLDMNNIGISKPTGITLEYMVGEILEIIQDMDNYDEDLRRLSDYFTDVSKYKFEGYHLMLEFLDEYICQKVIVKKEVSQLKYLYTNTLLTSEDFSNIRSRLIRNKDNIDDMRVANYIIGKFEDLQKSREIKDLYKILNRIDTYIIVINNLFMKKKIKILNEILAWLYTAYVYDKVFSENRLQLQNLINKL